MKLGKSAERGNATPSMAIWFELPYRTLYSELILFRHVFSFLGLKEPLWRWYS